MEVYGSSSSEIWVFCKLLGKFVIFVSASAFPFVLSYTIQLDFPRFSSSLSARRTPLKTPLKAPLFKPLHVFYCGYCKPICLCDLSFLQKVVQPPSAHVPLNLYYPFGRWAVVGLGESKGLGQDSRKTGEKSRRGWGTVNGCGVMLCPMGGVTFDTKVGKCASCLLLLCPERFLWLLGLQ